MRNAKILIINNGLGGGGIERASVSLANHWANRGHNVTILALYQSEHFFTLHPDIKLIEPTFSRKRWLKVLYVMKMIFFTRRNIKQVNPDTILAFSEWTNPYVVLSWLGLNIPLFLTDRMSPLAKMPLVTEWLRKIMYPKATGIIAQTQFAKSILYQKTKASNIVVINNPVNPINRLEVPIKNRIVTVGRLSPEKGHRFLLQAFAKLNQPDWDLSIVGDGVEKENLVNLTKELKISHKVIFHGHLKDFSQQLSEAQIFVLPSLKEGFPNALLEAMSVPLACIASDTFNGNHEIIINGENGLLVKPGNVEDLYKAIENLINNPNLRARLKINAYKIREKLDFSIIAHKYLNVITNAYAIKKKFK